MARPYHSPKIVLSTATVLVSFLAPTLAFAESPQLSAAPTQQPILQQPSSTLLAFEPLIPSPKSSRGGGRRLFEPPAGQDAPGASRGGGRRTDDVCPQDRSTNNRSTNEKPAVPVQPKVKTLSERLTPLLPSNRSGLTISDRPTFLVYVPKTSARAMEFTIENDQSEMIYQMNVRMPATPGVVRLVMPESAPGLEVGKEYAWRVAFACQATVPAPEDPFTEGIIQRVQTAAVASNAGVGTLEAAKAYAKAGLWYDASAGVAALKYSNPNDPALQTTWRDLLGDVGLEDLSTAPLQN